MAASNTVGVDSYLELYTTVLGWQQYGEMWGLLTATGLVFVPFLGMLFRNVMQPLQSQQPGLAADVSLRRLEIDVISALVVILLAGQPLIELRPQELVMPKVCNLPSQQDKFETTYIGFDEDTLYKEAVFVAPSSVAKVPIWWYGVMAISSGVVQAAKVSMPCLGDMLTPTYFLKSQLFNLSPDLKEEVVSFINKCYSPTLNFMRLDLPKFDQSTQESYLTSLDAHVEAYTTRLTGTKHWRPDETSARNWAKVVMNSLLSPFFLGFNEKGLYKQRSVTFNASPGEKGNVLSCEAWWLSPRFVGDPLGSVTLIPSLQDKLRSLLDNPATYQSMVGILNSSNSASMTQGEKDLLLDRAIVSLVQLNIDRKNRPLAATIADFPDSAFKSYIVSEGKNALGYVSAFLKKWAQYPIPAVVTAAAPIAQAALLMTLYIIMPFGLVVSGYSIQFLVVGAIGVFSVKFLGYLIYLSFWMQNMFTEVTKHGGLQVSSDIHSIFEITMINSYFLFPAIYFGVVAWAGIQLGAGFQGAFDKLAGQQSSAIQGSTRVSDFATGQAVELAPTLGKAVLKKGFGALKNKLG